MRRLLLIGGVLLVSTPAVARGDQVLIHDFMIEPRWEHFDGSWRQNPQVAMRERIEQALGTERTSGTDEWAWRDQVEDRLVALGAAALPQLRFELETREGYEADAVRVAIFRLEHGGVNLRDYLLAWSQKRFGADGQEVRLSRIMGARAVMAHHLFYVVEAAGRQTQSKSRVVVALAADGKVQDVSDDVRLARFLHVEWPAAGGLREHAAELAGLLAASRGITLYQPQVETSASGDVARATVRLERLGVSAQVQLRFDGTGRVASLTSERAETATANDSAKMPETRTPPPALPE